MKALSSLVSASAVVVILTGSAAAERVTVPLGSPQLVTNAEGRVRIVLPCTGLGLPEHVLLGGARLALPDAPLSATRDLRIHVRAVTEPWVPGGDILTQEDLVGRLSLRAGTPARGVDVTSLVRGVMAGADLHGLLITPPEGAGGGFEAADAPHLLAAFHQAALEISFRQIPPPPARRQP